MDSRHQLPKMVADMVTGGGYGHGRRGLGRGGGGNSYGQLSEVDGPHRGAGRGERGRRRRRRNERPCEKQLGGAGGMESAAESSIARKGRAGAARRESRPGWHGLAMRKTSLEGETLRAKRKPSSQGQLHNRRSHQSRRS
jgi:hypothetical protein